MPIQHVVSELNRIQSMGLISRYAIGGAVAAQAYVEVSSTEDVDVFVIFAGPEANSLAPLAPIWADLIAHGAGADGMYLVIGDWPVQLLPPGTPLYEEAILAAQQKDFGGVVGWIMEPEHLAAIALATGRGKDYQRVEEFVTRGAVDMDRLKALITRHDLQARWTSFKSKFLTPDV